MIYQCFETISFKFRAGSKYRASKQEISAVCLFEKLGTSESFEHSTLILNEAEWPSRSKMCYMVTVKPKI